MKLLITPAGRTVGIYSDDFRHARAGAASIQRASHVEPSANGWTADLTPVNGPILGPYAKRKDALDAEIAWLEKHLPSISRIHESNTTKEN